LTTTTTTTTTTTIDLLAGHLCWNHWAVATLVQCDIMQ